MDWSEFPRSTFYHQEPIKKRTKTMDNECPKCEKLLKLTGNIYYLCLDCQLEQADADVLKAMNRVEELKQKIKKEKENGQKAI